MLAQSPSQTVADDVPRAPFVIDGQLTSKQVRKLVRSIRTGQVGPTSVYYAGVTAPAIAAGMAAVVSASLDRAGWGNEQVWFCASLVAAMAGISWYLIFMRLSYRHSYGRGSEHESKTHLEADELGVFWTRGALRVRVDWFGVSDIDLKRDHIRIAIPDGQDVLVPKAWFENRKAMNAAHEQLVDLWTSAEPH